MCNPETSNRIRQELFHISVQMGCHGFSLYKQDASSGYAPVISSSEPNEPQPPYISAGSDLTAYLRTRGQTIFKMQANTFRDQLVHKGISSFGVKELLVCPLSIKSPNDFILTFGSEEFFDDKIEELAGTFGKTFAPLLLEFVSAVENKILVFDLPAELNTASSNDTGVFKMLHDVFALNSYAYLIRAAENHLTCARGIILENRLGHTIASSRSEISSLRNLMTPLTYLTFLDTAQKAYAPLMLSSSMFISNVTDALADKSRLIESDSDSQCLVFPLRGDGEFIGFLSIFDIPRSEISKNISFIAGISFAATYLMRSHEASRNQTLRRILSSIENERRGVSIDLHDETSQNLVALNVRLATALRALEMQRYKESANILEDCMCINDNILTEVNRLSSELRSSELTYLGLSAAIEAEANHRLIKTGIFYSITGNAVNRHFDAFQETMLLKGVVEALSNCARHAQATNVVISLDDDGTWFSIQISDNGIGFDDAEIASWDIPRNYGMKTMHDCAESLGGIFWIGSYPGDGTTVRFSIPNRLLEGVSYE